MDCFPRQKAVFLNLTLPQSHHFSSCRALFLSLEKYLKFKVEKSMKTVGTNLVDMPCPEVRTMSRSYAADSVQATTLIAS